MKLENDNLKKQLQQAGEVNRKYVNLKQKHSALMNDFKLNEVIRKEQNDQIID